MEVHDIVQEAVIKTIPKKKKCKKAKWLSEEALQIDEKRSERQNPPSLGVCPSLRRHPEAAWGWLTSSLDKGCLRANQEGMPLTPPDT